MHDIKNPQKMQLSTGYLGKLFLTFQEKNNLIQIRGPSQKRTFMWGQFVSDQCDQQQTRRYSTLTFTMNVKSVKAGEYTAPPAQGPITREIWGTTPEHRTFLCNRRKKKDI